VVWLAPDPVPAPPKPFAAPLPVVAPLPVAPPLPKIEPDEDDAVLPVWPDVAPLPLVVVPAPPAPVVVVVPEVVLPVVAVTEAPPAPLELDELDELHGALQLFWRHVMRPTNGWSLEQVDGGFAEPAHVMQFWSLPQATNWLQQELSMHASQVGSPVGIWPAHAELPLLVVLELAVALALALVVGFPLVVELALVVELEVVELPPHAFGYVFEGSAPPGGATHP
jgi:hypothetical protein